MIYGPESSGNRLLRRILIAGGCAGDPGLDQSFDKELPMAEDVPLIVWGRSVPGNVPPNSWPSFYIQDIGQARKHGYDVFGLVMVRDWYCMAQSQVDTEFKPAQHVWQANRWSAIAYTRIFDAFDRLAVPFYIITYEAIIQRPERFVSHLYQDLGLKLAGELEPIYDGNAKYYEKWNRVI